MFKTIFTKGLLSFLNECEDSKLWFQLSEKNPSVAEAYGNFDAKLDQIENLFLLEEKKDQAEELTAELQDAAIHYANMLTQVGILFGYLIGREAQGILSNSQALENLELTYSALKEKEDVTCP